MTYFSKNDQLKRGYNAYIDAAQDDMGTQMDIGLLVMEDGDVYTIREAEKETAVLLFAGCVTYQWDGKTVEASRPDCFHHEAYCLLAGKDTEIVLTAHGHSELYIQKTLNDKPYEAVLYTPDTVQTEHKGFSGELMGCMSREIKTFFDLDNAPFSNMVLGEVLNLPGKWSSYPPHPSPPAGGLFLPFRLPPRLWRGLRQRRDLQDRPQRLRRHHQRLPLPDRRAGLRHVLRLGHPASAGGPLGQDPHRRQGARVALEAGRQRAYLPQSLIRR